MRDNKSPLLVQLGTMLTPEILATIRRLHPASPVLPNATLPDIMYAAGKAALIDALEQAYEFSQRPLKTYED